MSQREANYGRQDEHRADALLLLERLRRANLENYFPSTAELQGETIYGLRPVNRLVDLRRGKYGHKYDIEKINCAHGTFRWRLHEPNRLGYPKDKNQPVLPIEPVERPDYHQSPQIRKARPSPGAWKSQTIFTTKSWEQVCAERDRKMNQPEPEWSLTP